MFTALIEFLADDTVRNLTVLVGVVVAIISIWTSRVVARRKQSADLLFASRGDPQLQAGAATILEHHLANDKNIRAVESDANRDGLEAKAIRYVLNHFELVSVGIQNKIYDEAMIKESWCSIVCETYKQVTPYIEERRSVARKETIYQEFEWLAKRWKSHPLTVKEPKRWWQFWRL